VSADFDDTADGFNAWPAFVDLFSATSLLFIAFLGVYLFQLQAARGNQVNQRQALIDRLRVQSDSGRLFLVDTSDRQFVRLVLRAKTTFPTDSSRLSSFHSSGREAIKRIARSLSDSAVASTVREIRVIGHSDQEPYKTNPNFSNWELSSARAAVISRYLVDSAGADPCKISATGRGPYFPRTFPPSRATAEDNRRIEIEVLPSALRSTEEGPRCFERGDGSRTPGISR